MPEKEWDRVLDINLKGTFLCMEYEAGAMLAGGHGGAIVNVGSVNSFLGFPTGSAYVASKHGQIGLTTSVSVCSDEASYITGTTLTPDGGFTSTI